MTPRDISWSQEIVLPVGQNTLTRDIDSVKVLGIFPGKPAPDFEATTLDGKPFKLSSLRGKVVLVDFWATWCAPCVAELPNIKKLHDQHSADGLVVVSVSFDPTNDRPEALRLYAGALRIDGRLPWEFATARSMGELLPLLDDFGQDVRVEMDARGRPMRTINHMLKLFLIDRSGVVREIYALDYLHPDMMMNDIETLLLEERAQGVAGDALGEAGEVGDVLAVEHLASGRELLEQQRAAAIAGGEDAGGVAGGPAAHDQDVLDVRHPAAPAS